VPFELQQRGTPALEELQVIWGGLLSSPTMITQVCMMMKGGGLGDLNGLAHLYRDETWGKDNVEYDPPRRPFTGCGGPTFEAHHRIPTFLMLFRLFWPDTLLQKICAETNRYATMVDGDGNAPGGRR
jgi:hypothetical protein